MTEGTQKGNCCESTTSGSCCVGMKVEDVTGLWRIVHQDGVDFAVTMDYNPSRKNLTVINGVVTACSMG